MPRLKSRARSATRRYWRALVTSGAWGEMHAMTRVQVGMLMQLVDDMNTAETPQKRARYRAEIVAHERELGLRGPLSSRGTTRRPARRRSPAEELDALA